MFFCTSFAAAGALLSAKKPGSTMRKEQTSAFQIGAAGTFMEAEPIHEDDVTATDAPTTAATDVPIDCNAKGMHYVWLKIEGDGGVRDSACEQACATKDTSASTCDADLPGHLDNHLFHKAGFSCGSCSSHGYGDFAVNVWSDIFITTPMHSDGTPHKAVLQFPADKCANVYKVDLHHHICESSCSTIIGGLVGVAAAAPPDAKEPCASGYCPGNCEDESDFDYYIGEKSISIYTATSFASSTNSLDT